MIHLLQILAVTAFAQEGAPEAGPRESVPNEASATPSESAEALRTRIHGMRMNLLLGGERVREAESQAISFYNDKVELVESRLDTIEVELSERNASYDVVLEQALDEPGSRATALRDAARLRSEIGALEAESAELGERRGQLSKLIVSVEARDRERERLATELETAGSHSDPLGLPFMRIGLAPDVEVAPSASPLANDALVRDLLARDPRAARELLFETDPVGYWQRFPLQPPRAALQSALPFPPADLPGRR